ncbi:uncharacterized protein LOC106671823 [Cimex lectularius]|uniref:Uncharacterized protein n=1 Tax=Cimex lectularius TaxID=79782 RepID=A0A8I6SJ22_CIMLE|nr:uncharacterized protein LOC106671823 [Cimex lectularius]
MYYTRIHGYKYILMTQLTHTWNDTLQFSESYHATFLCILDTLALTQKCLCCGPIFGRVRMIFLLQFRSCFDSKSNDDKRPNAETNKKTYICEIRNRVAEKISILEKHSYKN